MKRIIQQRLKFICGYSPGVYRLFRYQLFILPVLLLCFQVRNFGQLPENGDSLNCSPAFKIVVLGSSTAYGTGAVPIDSSFVNKYKNYIQSKNSQNTIINLATLGLTTYHVLCPTGFVPPANRPFFPDTNRNITKALSHHPDAIIINLPSNDIALGIPQQESKDNYERTMWLADSANIPVWVTTTQPRNTLSPTERIYLMEFRDWTYQRFGGKAIDFWTDVANPDGTINPLYSFGDGVHINNNGHHLFYTRTMNERILDSLCVRHIVLPLKLISFKALLQNNRVNLTWETEDEAQIDHFEIERSYNNGAWELIDRVPAFNSPGRHTYYQADNHPVRGVTFYRLKQTDQNGSFSYSRTVNVNFQGSGPISIIPNPASGEVVIQSENRISAITLTDLNGKIIKQYSYSVSNRYTLGNIAAGMYIIKIYTGVSYYSARLMIR